MSLLGGIELAPLITKIKVDVKGFKSEMEQVKTEAVTKSKEVSKQMEKTIKVGENMSKLGGTMTKALTVPIAGAGVAATKMAIDFETSFAKVSTLLDSNVVDYDQYKNDILDASSKSKIAVGEFSESVYQSISAGVDQRKAIGFTTEAMKLAKGGFTDGAKAVDVLTTAINVYGMSAEDVTRVSDVLINTQNLGKTTVDELASSIGMVLPITSQLNMSFEDTMAVMATLTKNGIGTSQAVTGLKAALSNIVKPTTEAADAAEILGIDFSSAALQSKGLIPFLDDIKTSMESAAPDFARMSDAVFENRIEMQKLEEQGKKNTDQYKQLKKTTENMEKDMEVLAQASDSTISGFATLFGSVEGLNSMMVLTSETGSKDLQASMDAMYNSAGAAQTAFDKMDATPAEKMKGALNELKNSAIKLGAKLIPVVTKIADKISELVEWFEELSPAQQENIVKMGGMIAVAGPLLKVTGGLVQGYGKLKPLIKGTSTLFSKGAPIVGKFATKLAESTGLIGKVGGALTKLVPAASSAVPALTGVAGSATAMGGAAAGGITGLGALATSLGSAAVAAAPFVVAGGAVAAAGYGIYKCLSKDVIPEVDLFADKTTAAYNQVTGVTEYTTVKISEETQKQVQSYLDLSNSAQQESMNMYTGITAITDTGIASITEKVNGMANSVITATNTQRDEVVKGYQDMFANTTVLTAQEQLDIMASVNSGYDERITKTTELKNELTEIYQDIATNGNTITQNQQQRIDQIYEEMKVQAVQAMAENEAEQNVILNRLSGSNERITAEMVGNSIVQMNELRDKSIQSAAEKRDALVLEAEKLKTLEGGKYAEKAQQIIDSANDEYEGSVKAAEKLRTEGIDKLMTAHEELANKVSVNTGEVISNFERWTGAYEKWEPTPKNARVIFSAEGVENIKNAIQSVGDKIRSGGFHYNGLDYVPFDGYNAHLHEGERVLTKKENEQYTKGMQGISGAGKIVLDVSVPVEGRELAHATKEFYAEELGFNMG